MTSNENAPVQRKKLPIAETAQQAAPSVQQAPDNDLPKIEVADLAGVIYSSGKVFEGLSTGRLDTESFLRSGSTEGVTSRQDLHVLQDLRDVAQLVIDHRGQPIDAAFAKAVNSTITRSGSMYPGRLRRDEQSIGVDTSYGRHEPPAIDDAGLQELFDRSARLDPKNRAVHLFVEIAKAQPFWDGNKRTGLFVANAVLLEHDGAELLTIPFDEKDPSVARTFNDRLARAYRFDEIDGVTELLREQGFSPMKTYGAQADAPAVASRAQNSSLEARKAQIAAKVAALDHGDQDDQFER